MLEPRGSIRRARRSRRGDDESGFGLAEVMAATVILVVVVISFSNLLIDSLSADLTSRQREVAASIASDTIENAQALGQAALSSATPGLVACPVPAGATLVNFTPPPVLTQVTFLTPYTTTVNNYMYTVCSTIAASSSTADTVAVLVTWSSGQKTFGTTSQVGT